ncbi:MAG: choice-of-anchor L domain-containing protein [Chitinophagales bacterium]|nr:choice-of-anchor L domain-containing protein [Chitinophagales bacterium]
MNQIRSILLYALLLSSLVSMKAQQIMDVTPLNLSPFGDPANLIRNYFTGSGIEVIQVESSNVLPSIGHFVDGVDAIGFQRGLVLSTGFVAGIADHGVIQASDLNSSNITLPELTSIATDDINDVIYLRITFKPYADSIHFRFAFGSEEYPEYACTFFNDVFGFFLSGPKPGGGTYNSQNIALIPGTNLPVSIYSIHPENQTAPPCPAKNDQYYVNNLNSNIQPVFDGFTTPFSAEASVIPCETYTMLLAIADVGDAAYDSGVFLEAKSLESPVEISSSLPSNMPVFPEIATLDTFLLTFDNIHPDHFPLKITFAGTATNSVDYQTTYPFLVITSPSNILHLVIQPIQDTLNEPLETIILNIDSDETCFHTDLILYISDSDSLFQPTDTLSLPPNGSLKLHGSGSSLFGKTWTFSLTSNLPVPNGGLLVESAIEVELPFERLDNIAFLDQVCLNITHSWDADMDIYLIAPNQSVIELTTDNGGNGDNYTSTCFSPAASNDIRGGLPYAPASAAPFTGIFQPESPWTDILGTPLNGEWRLALKDDQNSIDGVLQNWSISFTSAALDNFQYLWSNGDTTPTMTVNAPGVYQLEATNTLSSFTKTFVVIQSSVSTQSPETAEQVFQLSPNPSTGEVTVQLLQPYEVISLKVYNPGGTCLLQQAGAGTIQGGAQLPKGIYLIALETTEGIFTQKLVRW